MKFDSITVNPAIAAHHQGFFLKFNKANINRKKYSGTQNCELRRKGMIVSKASLWDPFIKLKSCLSNCINLFIKWDKYSAVAARYYSKIIKLI